MLLPLGGAAPAPRRRPPSASPPPRSGLLIVALLSPCSAPSPTTRLQEEDDAVTRGPGVLVRQASSAWAAATGIWGSRCSSLHIFITTRASSSTKRFFPHRTRLGDRPVSNRRMPLATSRRVAPDRQRHLDPAPGVVRIPSRPRRPASRSERGRVGGCVLDPSVPRVRGAASAETSKEQRGAMVKAAFLGCAHPRDLRGTAGLPSPASRSSSTTTPSDHHRMAVYGFEVGISSARSGGDHHDPVRRGPLAILFGALAAVSGEADAVFIPARRYVVVASWIPMSRPSTSSSSRPRRHRPGREPGP